MCGLGLKYRIISLCLGTLWMNFITATVCKRLNGVWYYLQLLEGWTVILPVVFCLKLVPTETKALKKGGNL